MSDNPITNNPDFRIFIEGEQLSNEIRVLGFDLGKVFNKIAWARLTISDGLAHEQKFPISDGDKFLPGKKIEIKTGYENEFETLWKGVIVTHGVRARSNRAIMSSLVIEAWDAAIKLTGTRKSAYHLDSKDSEIIEQLAGDAGLEKDIAATKQKHKEMVQYHTTDWDFILTRAEANGHLVLTDNGKLRTMVPKIDGDGVAEYAYGNTMLEFEADLDPVAQMKSVKSKSWNFTDLELLETEGTNPSLTENGNITADTLADVLGVKTQYLVHPGKFEEQELKDWIDGRVLRNKLARSCGRVRVQGTNKVKVGDVIKISGVGDRFNGKVYVTGLRHQFDAANWTTDIQFGLGSKMFFEVNDIKERSASGMLPGINGLHIGVVTKLGSDPNGEDRIQVKMPTLDNTKDGVWARVCVPDGGKERGIYFRPEVNDEVLLGFLNDDPRQPIVIGHLNSKKNPAPVTAGDDNNHIKGIYTRSKMKLWFDDDKKIATLETPASQKIVVDDDAGKITLTDKSGNSIEMSDKGITIKSAKDIIMEATGDIKMKGVNIEAKSDANMTVKGGAQAEFSSGGSTALKGSIVQIN